MAEPGRRYRILPAGLRWVVLAIVWRDGRWWTNWGEQMWFDREAQAVQWVRLATTGRADTTGGDDGRA